MVNEISGRPAPLQQQNEEAATPRRCGEMKMQVPRAAVETVKRSYRGTAVVKRSNRGTAVVKRSYRGTAVAKRSYRGTTVVKRSYRHPQEAKKLAHASLVKRKSAPLG